MDDATLGMVICPGCGWIGIAEDLADSNGNCPDCSYENGLSPYRLLTIKEMLEDVGDYNDVRMGAFLAALFRVLAAPQLVSITRRR